MPYYSMPPIVKQLHFNWISPIFAGGFVMLISLVPMVSDIEQQWFKILLYSFAAGMGVIIGEFLRYGMAAFIIFCKLHENMK